MPAPTEPGSGRNIGILADGGGFALYASWLAVLWEGCAVVPLSAETPIERLGSIMEDAEVSVVLVTDEGGVAVGTRLRAKGSCSTVSMLDVRPLEAAGGDSVTHTGSGEPFMVNDEEGGTSVCQTAYLYYTSGSSGEPKGVYSGHAPMMNRLRWMQRQWPFAEDEVCCQRVDHIFIDFVAEVFGPLSCGVPILVVPYAVRRNPILMRDFICIHGVTRITLIPTLARLLVEATNSPAPTGSALRRSQQTPRDDVDTPIAFCFDSVRLWVLSGEALPWIVARGLAKLSLPTAHLLNMYGSTEVAADVTFYSRTCAAILMRGSRVPGEHSKNYGGSLSYPIGRPITGCGLELMDIADLKRAGPTTDGPPAVLCKIPSTSIGRVGVVYISGAALASGYWGRPAATEERFPSYTWNSTSSSYHLCSSSLTDYREPETAPNLSPTHKEPANCCESDGEARKPRDQRSVRFFCTGDLASFERRHTAGGDDGGEGWNLVYRGRLDQQIKLVGRRLDLGEVEACVLRVRGVTLATAVAVSAGDPGRCQDGHEEETLGSTGNSVVGVVVSPLDVEEAAVRAECRLSLPDFAVPQLVVIAPTIPTLPGSGKADRRTVKRMLLDKFHHRQGIDEASNQADGLAIPTLSSTRQGGTETKGDDVDKIVELILVAIASTFKFHGEKKVEPGEDAPRRASDTHFFAEAGLSSVQAVIFLQELRHKLVSCGSNQGLCVRHTVGLIDLYSYPTARSLAHWLVSRPLPASTESKDERRRDPICLLPEATHGTVNASNWSAGNRSSSEECRGHESLFNGVTINPMSADLWAKTSALFSSVFLSSEPLIGARFDRYRTTIGPAGTAVVRRCHKRMLSRSLRSILRGGGRVLIATSDTTGQVVGFTVGTELVEPAQGSGFLASGAGGGLAEERAWARPRSAEKTVRTKKTLWESCTDWLWGIPLRSLMRPISDILRELMTTYRFERGWAYAPGDLMFISETGCRLDQRGKAAGKPNMRHGRNQSELMANKRTRDGDNDANDGGSGGSGFRAAVLAELLERRLLSEATAAGFIRAVTICTNAVTIHVARELGFREVARVSPVQTYHPPRRTRDGVPTRKKEKRQGPFARVPQEHAHVVLFEKVIAPTVPLELLLDRRDEGAAKSDGQGETSTATFPSATVIASPTDLGEYKNVSAATAGREMWKIVPVGAMAWSHHCEMLAILANSLPFLASSGRAVEYMADDIEQGQEAFALLTAPHTASVRAEGHKLVQGVEAAAGAAAGMVAGAVEPDEAQSDVLIGSLPVAPVWTVAACMSWRRGRNTSEFAQNGRQAGADEPVSSDEGTNGGKDNCSGPSSCEPCQELLVLAVGRRWRYRGVGASLIHRLLAESRRKGNSFVYVRSLLEAVSFYERRGFRRVRREHIEGKGELLPPSNGEYLMVYDLARCFSHA